MLSEEPRTYDSPFAERKPPPTQPHPSRGTSIAALGVFAASREAALEEHDALTQRLNDLWGPKRPYEECEEDRTSLVARMWYAYVYPIVLLASRERLTTDMLPAPTEDVRAHECGLRLSRAVQAALQDRSAWDCMVGSEVTSTLDAAARGVLRWVGVPQQGGYTRMMAGVEWSVPPAVRTAATAADDAASPFFDGVAHGEHLFVPERSGVSTLEEVTCVTLLSADGTPLDACAVPTPARISLTRLLLSSLPEYFWWQIPLKLVGDLCTLTLPFLLRAFVAFISGGDKSWAHGLGLVASFFVTQLLQSLCLNRFYYVSIKGGLQYRSALNALIFEKVFTISNKALARPEMNTGRIINMMSTDTEQANQFMQFCMYIWSSPMTFLISIVFMSRLVGWCALMAVVAMVATLPINASIMQWQMASRRQLVKATDARVKATNEFLSGMRVAKFMTWEPRFIANIEARRAEEVAQLRQVQMARVLSSFISVATPQLMIAAVFVAYYLIGHDLTADVVYPTIALLGIIRMPFLMLPFVFTVTVQYLVSIARINKFLECDNAACSSVEDVEGYFKSHDEHSTACQLAAVLEGVDVAAYVPVKLPLAPRVRVPLVPRLLRMLCCGRCRPLKKYPTPAAVAEAECAGGAPVSPASPASPASPSPSAGGRGGSGGKGGPGAGDGVFELERKVLLHDVCVRVPRGRLTVVLGATGSGKSTLLQSLLSQFEISCGRVWAERSIAYVSQQAWIMNATVRGNILFFDEEDAARLAAAIRVSQLEPDLALLGGGLETEIGEKGVNLSGGQKARVSLARAVYADRDVYLLDDPLSALDAHVGERVVEECVLGALAGKTRVLATHQMHVVAKADHVVALSGGRVEFSGSSADFMRTPLYAQMTTGASDDAEAVVTGKGDAEADDLLDREPPTEEAAMLDVGAMKKATEKAKRRAGGAEEGGGGQLIMDEEKASGGVPWSAYVEYFRYCGGVRVAVSVVLVFAVTEGITMCSSVWLASWTRQPADERNRMYLVVYLCLVLSGAAGFPLRFAVSYNAMRRGCSTMHRAILRSVTAGTMEFFDRTPLGRLLNRFSRDIDTLDNALQMSTIALLESLFSILAATLVTAYSQPFVLIALVPCGYVYYRLMIFFNSANRETRRTSSLMKTPVFTLLTELTNGMASIAAYGKAKVVMAEALRRLDVVYSCTNLENNMNRWLAVRIEFLSNVVVSSIALVGVVTICLGSTRVNIELVALSLTMAMQTTGQLNWLVRTTASLEADMNSVERILYYTHQISKEDMPELDEEVAALAARAEEGADATGTVVVEPAGPAGAVTQAVQAGSLVFDGVQMRYREGLPLVLRDVSFRIAPREKVGVVGRTGSGKSTLLLTFLRMVEVCGGSIAVNGRAIGAYGLRELRRQFSMIPQDPVLFDGTVRLNVDPFLEASAAEVWAALELVGLRERVAAEAEGIDSRVLEGGSNYSVGQRQLMCMARALLKKGSGFILMDEATANIDPALDRQIQTTVMSAFAAYTVITIAHRLHTVAQYDKIIVMDHGVVAEMGSPRELSERPGSVFRGMVEALGPSESARVMQLMAASGSSAAPR